jgi:hypothetical protein
VNDLPELSEHMPVHQRQNMFTHDWAPPHFLCTVKRHLNETFDEKWIKRGGPFNLPARSPDLNPLDFFTVGTPKGFDVFSVDE